MVIDIYDIEEQLTDVESEAVFYYYNEVNEMLNNRDKVGFNMLLSLFVNRMTYFDVISKYRKNI